MPCRFEL